jgi:hypothetical protein
VGLCLVSISRAFVQEGCMCLLGPEVLAGEGELPGIRLKADGLFVEDESC